MQHNFVSGWLSHTEISGTLEFSFGMCLMYIWTYFMLTSVCMRKIG